jgi:membrane fusion protein, copper/silver efflux system
MRKSYIVKILFAVVVLSFSISCKDAQKHAIEYTCPMHPQVIKDGPGKCPICGMDLVPKDANKELIMDTSISTLTKPVNAQVISSIPIITAESGTRIFSVEVNGTIGYDTRKQTTLSSRVSGRIEKLNIKYNYQPVKKGELIMEIYSPDLAAAQREFLYVVETADEVMIKKARQRLELLGMRTPEINDILYEKEVLYRIPVYSNQEGYIIDKSFSSTNLTMDPSKPSSAAGMEQMNAAGSSEPSSTINSPVNSAPILLREGQYVSAAQPLFTIYHSNSVVANLAFDQQTASHIKPGEKILLYVNNDRNNMFPARIGLIEPVYRNGQSLSIARVYLDKNNFQVGQLLKANIPVVIRGGWWLPKKAVWQLGTRSMVFKKEGSSFIPVEVKTGAAIKDMMQIQTDISDWQIASNAYYLVDSESFIKVNK